MKKDDEFSAGRADEEKELELLREYFNQLVQLGINFRQDWVFRVAFGRVESIPFLRGMINGVFRNADEPLVDSIKIKNPFSFGVTYGSKDTILGRRRRRIRESIRRRITNLQSREFSRTYRLLS